MIKQIKAAAKADVTLLNQIQPPTQGMHAGGGIHVAIPADWEARIASGEDVAGCGYAKLREDGSLLIDDFAQNELLRLGRQDVLARVVPLDPVVATPLPTVEVEL